MTPDEAQWAIHDAEYIGANLPGECWRALETCAGMREEWGVKYSESAHDSAHIAWGFRSESSARHYRAIARNTGNETPRIVRRYVTTPEEI